MPGPELGLYAKLGGYDPDPLNEEVALVGEGVAERDRDFNELAVVFFFLLPEDDCETCPSFFARDLAYRSPQLNGPRCR